MLSYRITILKEWDSGNAADRVGCIAWQLARLRQLHVVTTRALPGSWRSRQLHVITTGVDRLLAGCERA